MAIFMTRAIFIFAIFNYLTVIESGRILVVSLVPVSSYVNFITSVLDTLAPYHEITLYSMRHEEYNHSNVTLKFVKFPPFKFVNNENILELLPVKGMSAMVQETVMALPEGYVTHIMNSTVFQELLATKTRYDLLISYVLISEFVFPFAHALQAPLIQLAASIPYPWQNEAIGMPNFFSTDHSILSDESSDNFFDRLRRFVNHAKTMIRYNWFYLPYIDAIVKRYFPPNTPSVQEAMKTTSLLLVNTHEAMGYSRPALSNYVEVGGIHCRTPKSLPAELERIMQDSGDHGIIYFSFGSTIGAKFPQTFQKAVLNVFKKLPHTIIWKWNEHIEGLPPNVKVFKWLPQQDILGHNKTRLFITHGGILSLQESVYHGVPVLVVPICYDQPSNARLTEKLGYGRYFRYFDFSKERFLSEINEVISKPKYKANVQRISRLMKDEQWNSTQKMRWWVDYIIRHKGLPLYRPSVDQHSWFTTVDTDIILFIFVGVVSTCIFSLFIFTFMKNIIVRKNIKFKMS